MLGAYIVKKQDNDDIILDDCKFIIQRAVLDGDEKTHLYLRLDDYDFNILLATLSKEVPQMTCEIPVIGKKMNLFVDTDCNIHVVGHFEEDTYHTENVGDDDDDEEDDDDDEFVEECLDDEVNNKNVKSLED